MGSFVAVRGLASCGPRLQSMRASLLCGLWELGSLMEPVSPALPGNPSPLDHQGGPSINLLIRLHDHRLGTANKGLELDKHFGLGVSRKGDT